MERVNGDGDSAILKNADIVAPGIGYCSTGIGRYDQVMQSAGAGQISMVAEHAEVVHDRVAIGKLRRSLQ